MNQFTKQPSGLCFSQEPLIYEIQLEKSQLIKYDKMIPVWVQYAPSTLEGGSPFVATRYFINIITGYPSSSYLPLQFDIAPLIAPYVHSLSDIVKYPSIRKSSINVLRVRVGFTFKADWTPDIPYPFEPRPDISNTISVVHGRRPALTSSAADRYAFPSRMLSDGTVHYYREEVRDTVIPLWCRGSFSSVDVENNGHTEKLTIENEYSSAFVVPLSSITLPLNHATISIASTPLVEIVIDPSPRTGSYTLFKYLSGAGVYEYCLLTGDVTANRVFQAEGARFIRYNSLTPTARKMIRPCRKSLTISTGYIPQHREVVIDELLTSEEVYCVLTDNQEIPVYVTVERLERKVRATDPVGYTLDVEFMDIFTPYIAKIQHSFLTTEQSEIITTENNKKIRL